METSLYSLSVQKYSSLQTQENYYMVFASFLAGILVLLLIPQRGFFCDWKQDEDLRFFLHFYRYAV